MTSEQIKANLQYIADSPPREHGGFHPQTVETTAMAALEYIRKLDEERAQLMRYTEQLIHSRFPALHLFDDPLGRIMQIDNGFCVQLKQVEAELESLKR